MNKKPKDTLGFYKPKQGLKVKGPELRFRKGVPAAGAWIPRTSYWQRIITDGDLVEATAPATKKTTTKKTGTNSK